MGEGRMQEVRGALECLADLEDAIQAHVEWVNQVHRTLIFRQPPPPQVAATDAHQHCAFGQWYDTVGHQEIRESPAYRDIDVIHEKVHQIAADLVAGVAQGAPDEALYEAFTAYVGHLMELLRRLEGEVWSSISTKDALTGLYNRQAMDAFLKRATDSPRGCLVLCDIDHFKRVNDTYGHQAGDDVLRIVAQCLLTQLRSSDIAYRYGGEEFLLYLNGVDMPVAQTIAERLRLAVAEMDIPIGHSRHLHITMSFGIAVLEAASTSQNTVANADAALYLAKNTGRNKVCIHTA